MAGGLLATGLGLRSTGAGAGADEGTAAGSGAAPDIAPVRIMPLGDSITLGNGPERSYRGHLQTMLLAAGHRFDFVGSYGNVIPPGGEAIWFGPDAAQSAYRGPFDPDFEGHGGFQAGQPESVVGYKDHMLAQMVPTDIPLFAPDVVLVHIGTNDLLGGWTIHGPWHGPGGPADRRIEFAARNVIDLVDAIGALRPTAVVLVSPIGRRGLNGVQDDLADVSAVVRAAVEARAAQGRAVQFVADLYDGFAPADLADVIHPTDGGYAKMAAAWFRALHPVLCALNRPGLTVPACPAPPPTVPATPAIPVGTVPDSTTSTTDAAAATGVSATAVSTTSISTTSVSTTGVTTTGVAASGVAASGSPSTTGTPPARVG